jgi:phage baseplate assembly protein gpV
MWSHVLGRLNALEQRIASMNIQGKVTDVDAAKGLYRQTVGKDDDGQDVKSPWVPYAQHAGQVKIHLPPSVGQLMSLNSNGDMQNGHGVPLSWSDSNQAPNDKGNENTATFGPYRIDWKGDDLRISGPKITLVCGGVTLTLTSDGLTQTGGFQKHDGKNVGKDHVHDEVVKGGDLTGHPQP